MGDLKQSPILSKVTVIQPPAALQPWLYAKGSITQMARQRCADVSLDLLHNDWSSISQAERQYYSMREHRAFLREINMICDGDIWWYARTLIPQVTYDARLVAFDALDDIPIGTILFSDPEIKRLDLQVSDLNQEHPIRQWAGAALPYYVNRCWIRYSLYHIQGLPLYMHEVFLPQMIDSLCSEKK